MALNVRGYRCRVRLGGPVTGLGWVDQTRYRIRLGGPDPLQD